MKAIHNERTNGRAESPDVEIDVDRATASLREQPVERRLTEKVVVDLKSFDQLLPLFQRLHADGCQRDKAGNRKLHFDQYCLMVLVFLFQPACLSSQQASELTVANEQVEHLVSFKNSLR